MSNYDILKKKIKLFLHWIISELKDWHTILLFIVVCIVMYSPVYIGYGLHFLFHISAGSVVATSYLLFWAGPFTPFFPMCLAITLFIRRLIEKHIF